MEFNTLASPESLQKVIDAVQKRGVTATAYSAKEEALEHIKTLIPANASVMTGASITLEQIGLEAMLIQKKHPWKNLKDEIAAEKDEAKKGLLRKQSILADYFLGSVHAIAETGEIVIASYTGSQLPAYAFSSNNVIWVAGTQKIVPTLDKAIERVRTYVLPLEDKHMKQLYGPNMGSAIGKLLTFERESPFLKRNLHLLLVNEILGF